MVITCRECGGKVSTEANACPHCGCPVKPKDPSMIYCNGCGKEMPLKSNKCPHCREYNPKAWKSLQEETQAILKKYERDNRRRWSWGGIDLD